MMSLPVWFHVLSGGVCCLLGMGCVLLLWSGECAAYYGAVLPTRDGGGLPTLGSVLPTGGALPTIGCAVYYGGVCCRLQGEGCAYWREGCAAY